MECMCAKTRSRFILSSEKSFWGVESGPMLTPREKSPLLEINSPQRMESTTLHPAGQQAQHTTNDLFRPQQTNKNPTNKQPDSTLWTQRNKECSLDRVIVFLSLNPTPSGEIKVSEHAEKKKKKKVHHAGKIPRQNVCIPETSQTQCSL